MWKFTLNFLLWYKKFATANSRVFNHIGLKDRPKKHKFSIVQILIEVGNILKKSIFLMTIY